MKKQCIKCNKNKELIDFHKNKSKKDGFNSECKNCYSEYSKKYRQINKKKIAQKRKEFYKNNADEMKRRVQYYRDNTSYSNYNELWKQENKEYISQYNKNYLINNRGKCNAKAVKRQIEKLQATPKWLTKDQLKQIEEFYILAKELEWLSKEKLHVDHIMPLHGKNSCGLHVPWNLQILPASLNIKKRNKIL